MLSHHFTSLGSFTGDIVRSCSFVVVGVTAAWLGEGIALATRKVRESESKYRTLFENLPQKIFFKDKNSVYISCNENYAGDLNINADEIAGKTDYDFFPKELAEKYRADDKGIMQSGEIEDIEEDYIQDGQKVFVHTVKTPIRDENSNVVGILGIFWDITARKQAEWGLRERMKELRCLYEMGRIVESSSASSSEEILARIVNVLSDSWQYPEIAAARITMDGSEYTTANWQETQWCQAADIRVQEQVCGAVQVCYPEQRPQMDEGPFVKEERDLIDAVAERLGRIVERKQAEQALAESEEKYRTLAEASAEGIFIIGVPGGEIKYANSAFTASVGHQDSEELLGRNSLEFIAPEDREQVEDGLKELARGGAERFEQSVRTLTEDGGTRWHELRAVPVRYEGKPAILGTGHDVTETHQLWQELNQQRLRDALTGVYNRHYFNETVIQEMKRADRYGHHTSFIMGDVDSLKAVNDNYGHLAGDQILQGIAHVLEGSAREADMVIRYGGDEFLVVMPETSADQAQAACRRIQQNLADWLTKQAEAGPLSPEVQAQVGFSMGVASCPPGQDVTIEEVLNRADEAMYRAKQAKRHARPVSA